MSVEFVDSNLLVYAHSSGGDRYRKAFELVARIGNDGTGAVSVQVLAEFYSVTTSKLKMKPNEAEDVIRDLGHWKIHRPGHSDVLAAIGLQRLHKLAWWDALILNSALELGAATLWTEDFSHGQKFGALTVRNPFR